MDDQIPVCGINSKLINDLLMEVFSRLPSAESASQCKCVCKRWFNLLSNSEFIARFVAHKINSTLLCKEPQSEEGDDQVQKVPFAYTIQFKDQKPRPTFFPNDPAFKYRSFSLSFIPNFEGEGLDFPNVFSCCKDLVLCGSSKNTEIILYLCNPRTKQFLKLPPPSRKIQHSFAFTYDPYYTFDRKKGSVAVSKSGRYCICHCIAKMITEPVFHLYIEIFYSETGTWRMAYTVPAKGTNYPFESTQGSFAYNGMVHIYWTDAILGFDPYKIRSVDGFVRSHSIDIPRFAIGNSCNSVRVGVYGEQIWMVQYASYMIYSQPSSITEVSIPQHFDYTPFYIKLWRLKNYGTGEWSLETMVNLHEFTSDSVLLNEHTKRACPLSMVMYMHPSYPHILLLELFGLFAECNLLEKTLKQYFPIKAVFARYGLTLPWWPSPLR